MVNIKLKYDFVETLRKFIIAKLSIRKLGSSTVLLIIQVIIHNNINIHKIIFQVNEYSTLLVNLL